MGRRYIENNRRINIKKLLLLLLIPVIIIVIILLTKNKPIVNIEPEEIPQQEELVIKEIYPPFDPYENAEKIEYTGPIEHVFFHPLVAYPELAFDGDYKSKGMDDYMATTTEFRKFIQELYDNNYILINVNEFYIWETLEDGTQKMVRNKVMFPVGKKPVILSIDDMNYYEYMRQHGCVHKLILDNKGNVATYTNRPDGSQLIAYDNEIVPILDAFVKEHQDFSFNGAKGIIGLTGFDGILGYRTNSDSANKESEIEAVKPVIARLKETGWIFASHSYGHFAFEKASYDKIKYDTDKWKTEVEPLIGETQVLLYPYGSWEPMNSKQHQYLLDSGFKIFCGVGIRQYEKIYKDFVFMDRKNIDGLTLRNKKNSVAHMFDTDKVIDLEARDRMKNL